MTTPSKIEASTLVEGETMATPQAVIAQIVDYAENIAWQAGVGSMETAGQIISFLADRPEMLSAFMDGSLSAIDTDLLDPHAGRLTWHGADGNVYAPDPAKAGRFREPSASPQTVIKHPSHVTRHSDASTYDEVCTLCGARDITGGGWGKLAEPCPAAIAKAVAP